MGSGTLSRVEKVTKLGLGQQAYFEKAVAKGMDDYYSGKGEAPGQFRGRLATELGLEGRVSAAQFNALLAGLDPRDPERLPSLVDPRSERKVAAYDLTFSAPKSVSVLAAIADQPIRRELLEAHDAAVEAAFEYVQNEAARVRRGKGGLRVEQARGLVAASYRHRMSRAQDPHLHTHMVTAAIAPGEDGRWTSLDARPLYRTAKAGGTIYQAHLRAEITDRLGLTWREPVQGLAELEAVSQAVLDEFSRRRQDLRKAALEQGLKLDELTIKQREVLALATRDRKQTVNERLWRDDVRARAAEHGLDLHAMDEMFADRPDVAVPGAVAQDVVDDALDGLAGPAGVTQMANAFERPDAIIGVAAYRREGMRGPQVLAATEQLLSRGDVFDVEGGNELDRRWTTAELVSAEQRLIAGAVGRAGEGCAQLDVAGVGRIVERSGRLPNEQQLAAISAVTTSGNGVDVVEARAGTGKTKYFAHLVREAYQAYGYQVIGAAPTGAAARTLTDEAGIKSWTIHAMLYEIERFGLSAGTVVLLDEAGMADTRHTERLLLEARRAGVKVIAVGDSGQLPSVQAGGWLKAVGDQVGRHELTETLRQRSVVERRALGALHAGAPGVWMSFAQDRGRLNVYTEDEPVVDEAIEAWTKAVSEHGIEEAVLMSRDNATRTLLNAGARQHWDEQGRLGERVDFGPIELAEGDRIICRRNDSGVDVDNGTRGTIRAVDEHRVVLETDARTVRELPASYVAEHVEHAYALTGHGMQGSTVEWAGVVATPEHLTRGWSYTALSRARGETMLYVSDEGPERDPDLEQEGPELAKERNHATTLWRIEQRMTVRDDEDLAIEQLPDPFIGAGRAGDRDVVDAPDPATPIQERGAEPLPAPLVDAAESAPAEGASLVLAGAQRELVALADIDARLALQAQSLPVREIERLDDIARQHQVLKERRAQLAQRLEEVPAPPRLGRDPHQRERGHLQSAVESHDEHLQAMHGQHQNVRAGVEGFTGRDARAVRAELRGITERREQINEEQRQRRVQLATEAVSRPPAWVEPTIGPRPADGDRALGDWKNAVRAVTDAQLQLDPAAPLDAGLPSEAPDVFEGYDVWQQAQRAVEAANRRLDRQMTRDLDVGFGPDV